MTLGERLHEIACRDERLVVGLSSGTSFDGIDAALVAIRGHGDRVSVELVSFACVPFERSLRDRIARAPSSDSPEITRLGFDVGEAFAAAALELLSNSGRDISDVHLIGSHGQTVYHDPPSEGRSGATLQVGEADVIARRTGVPIALHGGTGLSEEAFRKCIELGACTVNISTQLKHAFIDSFVEHHASNAAEYNPLKAIDAQMAAVGDLVRHYAAIFGCEGRATAPLCLSEAEG